MKRLRTTLMTIVALLGSTTVSAYDFEVDGIYYRKTQLGDNPTVKVDYRGFIGNTYNDFYVGDIVIPETVSYDGVTYVVTAIGGNAFEGCNQVTSILMPLTITQIEQSAFYNCTRLAQINIPEGITWIDNYTFYNCRSLTSIDLPSTINGIGTYAFLGCSKLETIQLPENLTKIGSEAFSGCSNLRAINIPKGITEINEETFYNCVSLQEINIPNGVTTINDMAFYGCSNLTSITIPNSVTSIKSSSFSGCSSLTSITIPNSVTSIGRNAFAYCDGLTNITIGNSVTSIGEGAFHHCYGIANIIIPNSVTSIGDWAFENCTNLTNITIPNSVTSIGDNAFNDCTSLKDIVCHSSTPPSCINTNAFTYVNTSNCTLYVPEEAIDTYKATAPWREFNIVSISILNGMILTDGELFENEEDKEVDKITYTRTLNNTAWNALYVPFEIPVSQLIDDYEVAYINGIHSYDDDDNGEIDRMSMEVVKVKSGTLHANHPYLIKARTEAAKQMNITVNNTTLYKAESTTLDCSSVYTLYEITGIYEKMTESQLTGCYAMSGGSWKQLASGSSLNPFRLYLRITSREGSPVKVSPLAMTRISIHVRGEENATSIEELMMQEQPMEEVIYDLMGRRVTAPQKGHIYIVNGKKRVY